ncbi:hypothetical protein F4604DRAFT_1686355 [Suillus subluteus]|nr:hypothetical protein F4604DRAFT_1686355 [Suillus subluteus]
MPFRKISRDVKLAAIRLHEQNILSLEQILACVGFSESTFWQLIKFWRETGDVVRHNYGPPGSFTTASFKAFIEGDVLPLCTPYPGRLSVLVMDNAKIHHGDGVAELIREADHTKHDTMYDSESAMV